MSVAGASLGMHVELAAIVGEQHVFSADANAHSKDFSIDDVAPAAVVSPASAEEVAAVLLYATERRLSVVPAGGMTKQSAGASSQNIDISIRTERMNALQHYDPGDLTVGFGAGMTIREAQRVLAEHQQFLPLDVAHAATATVGGVLAANAHGPMKSGFGGVRDYCLGIHFVTADGKIAKGGGKVVKNVAGYDLMKLLIGCYGTLGVITSANFKVFPLPRQTRTFIAEFRTLTEAIEFRDAIMRSPLPFLAFEIVSPHAHEYLRDDTTDARDPDQYHPSTPVAQHTHWSIILRASGSDNVLARYSRELGTAVSRVEDAREPALWQALSDFEANVPKRHRNAMIVSVNTTIASVANVLQAAERAATDQNMLFAAIGRAPLGNLVISFTPLSVDPPSAMQYANAVSALRASLPRDGSAAVLRCPKEAKPHFDLWGTTPTDLASMRKVRVAMDPEKILNRGRFLV